MALDPDEQKEFVRLAAKAAEPNPYGAPPLRRRDWSIRGKLIGLVHILLIPAVVAAWVYSPRWVALLAHAGGWGAFTPTDDFAVGMGMLFGTLLLFVLVFVGGACAWKQVDGHWWWNQKKS